MHLSAGAAGSVRPGYATNTHAYLSNCYTREDHGTNAGDQAANSNRRGTASYTLYLHPMDATTRAVDHGPAYC